MFRANDIRMLPTIAVTIPINEDHLCSWESPFPRDTMLLRTIKAGARVKGGAVKMDFVASRVADARYMAAGVDPRCITPFRPPIGQLLKSRKNNQLLQKHESILVVVKRRAIFRRRVNDVVGFVEVERLDAASFQNFLEPRLTVAPPQDFNSTTKTTRYPAP